MIGTVVGRNIIMIRRSWREDGNYKWPELSFVPMTANRIGAYHCHDINDVVVIVCISSLGTHLMRYDHHNILLW